MGLSALAGCLCPADSSFAAPPVVQVLSAPRQPFESVRGRL